MTRLLVLLLLLVLHASTPSPAVAQPCGWRVRVEAIHVIGLSVGPPWTTDFPIEFWDAGPPLYPDFMQAAGRASSLARDGAWWSITGPPPKHYFYPPHQLTLLELIYRCE